MVTKIPIVQEVTIRSTSGHQPLNEYRTNNSSKLAQRGPKGAKEPLVVRMFN